MQYMRTFGYANILPEEIPLPLKVFQKTEKGEFYMKFYICKHCGNVITKLTSAQVPVKCCGEEMHVLEAGVTDAAQEKHVPAVTVEGSLVKVDVGSERDALIHWFHPEEAPEAVFTLAEGQTAKAVYAYCNLHGLWKKDL